MARNFRFYVKKRGGRRTDSRRLGDLARVGLFALMFLGGVGFSAYLLATLIIPEWRVNRDFEEAKCTVLDKRLVTESRSESTLYRPELRLAYQIDGRSQAAWGYDVTQATTSDRAEAEAKLAPFAVGSEYPCWYDPSDPDRVVIQRGYTWSAWLLLLIPSSFVLVGGGGLVITLLTWGKSVERRASLAGRAVPIEIFPELATREDFPTVPQRSNLTESPGTKLAFRLPVDARPLWLLTLLVSLSGLIVLIAGTLSAFGILRIVERRADWIFCVFSFAWLLIGAVGLFYTGRRLLRATSAGPTILEISHHPVSPGETVDLFLRQPGRGQLKQLTLALVCDERAISQQGTNTRTEVRRVLSSEIASQDDVRLSGRAPFEARYQLQVPSRAMHSFKSSHNAVLWRFLLSGHAERGLSFERSFPIIVHPGEEQA